MNPAALPNTSNLGYSQISIANAGILAFVSGQVAPAADGSAVPEVRRRGAEGNGVGGRVGLGGRGGIEKERTSER